MNNSRHITRFMTVAALGLLAFGAITPAAWAGTSDTWTGGTGAWTTKWWEANGDSV